MSAAEGVWPHFDHLDLDVDRTWRSTDSERTLAEIQSEAADLGFDQRQVLSPAVVAALTTETDSATQDIMVAATIARLARADAEVLAARAAMRSLTAGRSAETDPAIPVSAASSPSSTETDSAIPSTPPAVDVVPVDDVRRSIAEVVAWQLMSVRTYDAALHLRNMANDLWHDLNLGGERLRFIAECGFPENPRAMYDAIAARTAPSVLELS